jgi:predicted enzyme related to lactoylglutathione lyase
MSTVTGIATVWLPVSDMARAVDFYSGTLGLSVKQQEEEWSELELDGVTIGLNKRESPSGDGGAVAAFHVGSSLEDAVEELGGEGVEFVDGISDHPWGRIAAFKDPDGNDLQLFEPPR